MNSAVLATTTHRKMEGVSDGTSTQVRVQIINKCKVLMASRRLYKKGSPHEEEDGEKRELEQKNSARTIVFQKGPVYIPFVSSD